MSVDIQERVLQSREWWVSVDDEPGTVWRGEAAIVAARACADELDRGDFIYESTDGQGNWRFVSEDGSTFAVAAVLASGEVSRG